MVQNYFLKTVKRYKKENEGENERVSKIPFPIHCANRFEFQELEFRENERGKHTYNSLQPNTANDDFHPFSSD